MYRSFAYRAIPFPLLRRNLSTSPALATVIVKRVYKPPLVKIPGRTPLETPQHLVDKSIIGADDDKWLIYEVEEKSQPHHNVKLILLRNVDDYGVKGQVVIVPFHLAHPKLLLPGFASYYTEENVEKHKDIILPEDSIINSSASAKDFIAFFSKRVFDVCLSSSTPWTIEKWHIKASLRKHRVWVNDEQIEIPGGKVTDPTSNWRTKSSLLSSPSIITKSLRSDAAFITWNWMIKYRRWTDGTSGQLSPCGKRKGGSCLT